MRMLAGVVLLLGVACAPVPVATPAAAPRADTGAAEATVDSALAVLTFDSAWSRIAHAHYDTAYNGVDWPAVRTELRPQAAAARTIPALRRVITEMLGRLGESHFGLIPREAAGALEGGAPAGAAAPGHPGLEVRLADGELLVWRIDPAGAAAAVGIRTGWALLSIDGRPVAPRLAALLALPEAEQRVARTQLLYRLNGELAGEPGDELALQLRNEEGAVEYQVPLRPRAGQVIAYGSLPPTAAVLNSAQVQLADGCAGVIRFTMWLVPLAVEFDDAVDEHRACDGIIIDLRGNPGGIAGMVMGTAGHFVDESLTLGLMKTRTTELRFRANPRRVRRDGSETQPFAGRVAILTDEMTASTSEFFAEALQAVGRARIFGTPSAGQALPALMMRLPTGDVMMYAVADFRGPTGSRLEGRGVVPDVIVETTREDLLQQRDAPLQAALAWIASGVAGGHHPGEDTGHHENR
ncbi:MAG: S41 family peptidase [Gemmatimonadota bacterium]